MAYKPIRPANPAEIRRLVQATYDRYMAGSRQLIGMRFDGLEAAVEAPTPELRQEAYDAFADRWPRKSQSLMVSVAREIVFEELSRSNHASALPMLRRLDVETQGFDLRVPPTHISGLGRNACIATMVRDGQAYSLQGNLVNVQAALAMMPATSPGSRVAPITIDPDFGLGYITGRTPELYGAEGSKELAEQAMGQYADVLHALFEPAA